MLGEEIRLRGKNDVRCFVLHVFLHQRHRDAGKPAAESAETAKESAIERREKAWDALNVENVGQVLSGPPEPGGTERFVRQLHDGGFVGRVLEHAVEFALLAALLRGLEF